MAITVTCPKCHADGTVPEEMLGERVKCLDCRHKFVAKGESANADEGAPITIECPECGHPGYVSEKSYGRRLKCNGCGHRFVSLAKPKPKPRSFDRSLLGRPTEDVGPITTAVCSVLALVLIVIWPLYACVLFLVGSAKEFSLGTSGTTRIAETTEVKGVLGAFFALIAILAVLGVLILGVPQGVPNRQGAIDEMAKKMQREMEEDRDKKRLEDAARFKAVLEDMEKHPNLYPR